MNNLFATSLGVLISLSIQKASPVLAFTTTSSYTHPSFRLLHARAITKNVGLYPQSNTQLFSSSTSPVDECSDQTQQQQENDANNKNKQKWMNYGLVISSFTDGVQKSPSAQSFLKYSLASVLTQHHLHQYVKPSLQDSALFSPCAGPDIDLLNLLEDGQDLLDLSNEKGNVAKRVEQTEKMLNWLQKTRSSSTDTANTSMEELRIVYIPTAMYALRKDSKNTPGKQRQRNRYDGKKKRNVLVSEVQGYFQDAANVMAVTLDLDDGSVKQPYSTIDVTTENTSFPQNGKEALTNWKPHLIYIEGGNTFWLQHCIDKDEDDNSWADCIASACTNEETPAVYVGKSAGAIIAGKWMETATWKEWDDPSAVPGKEEFSDWYGYDGGLNLVGGTSFFPHMNADWEELVQEKRTTIGSTGEDELICLEEYDACCIEGRHQNKFVTKGITSVEADKRPNDDNLEK